MTHKDNKITALFLQQSFVAALAIGLSLCLVGCGNGAKPKERVVYRHNQTAEYIHRNSADKFFCSQQPQASTRQPYAWEKSYSGKYMPLTKEYFRCKGSSLNPIKALKKEGDDHKEVVRYVDCGGSDKHSLPLKNGKEFVYPILIDLLNHVQESMGKRVIVTCGHRCPQHNSYVDPSTPGQYSKHQIGAEVSFYVQGAEQSPHSVVEIIKKYYSDNADSEYSSFKRWEKGDTQTQIQPWYNKEVFIKIFQKNEGRNFDNRHPYPYISIQVRYDRDLNERVSYSWDKAFKNYLRY